MIVDHISKYLTPEIKLSSYEDKLFKSDLLFEDHMLIWFISGETKIIQADSTFYFKTGDIFLIPRNHLATIINYPKDRKPHKTVVMHLTMERLKKFYEKIDVEKKYSMEEKKIQFQSTSLTGKFFSFCNPLFRFRKSIS